MSKVLDFFIHNSISNPESVQQYHKSPEIGHSKLVAFEQNGPCILDPKYTVHTTAAMEFGSLVDTLLTQSDSFTSIYYIPQNNKKLTPTEERLVDYFVNIEALPDFYNDEDLLPLLNECGFYITMRKDVAGRIQKAKSLSPIISEIINNKHKKFITEEQLQSAMNCVETLHTSEITKDIFADPKLVFYQVACFDSHIKALFDIIYVDIKNHIIYPIDLKTVSYPERDFIKCSFYKFEYYRQAEMYYYILQNIVARMREDWKIADFQFMVINKDTLSPLLYKFPIRYVNGQLQISKNTFVKPFKDILTQMYWHMDNKQYMYDRDTYIELAKRANDEKTDLVTIDILPPAEDKVDSEPPKNESTTVENIIDSLSFTHEDFPYNSMLDTLNIDQFLRSRFFIDDTTTI